MEKKMDINEFKQNLGLSELPEELEKLIYFEINESNKKEYSDGFIIRIDKKDGLKSWSKEDGFLNRLLPFARANASGSFYALWIDDNSKPLNRLPVVVFGDEGGAHIVAENILQLMHLITFDVEIVVNNDEAFFKNRRKKPSENLEKYLKWLKENYNLERTENPNVIIKNAQEKYQIFFDEWCSQYFKKHDKTDDIKFILKFLNIPALNEKAKIYNIKRLIKIVKTKPDIYKEIVKKEIEIIQSAEMKERLLKELK
jgi:hypothetical protein